MTLADAAPMPSHVFRNEKKRINHRWMHAD